MESTLFPSSGAGSGSIVGASCRLSSWYLFAMRDINLETFSYSSMNSSLRLLEADSMVSTREFNAARALSRRSESGISRFSLLNSLICATNPQNAVRIRKVPAVRGVL